MAVLTLLCQTTPVALLASHPDLRRRSSVTRQPACALVAPYRPGAARRRARSGFGTIDPSEDTSARCGWTRIYTTLFCEEEIEFMSTSSSLPAGSRQVPDGSTPADMARSEVAEFCARVKKLRGEIGKAIVGNNDIVEG